MDGYNALGAVGGKRQEGKENGTMFGTFLRFLSHQRGEETNKLTRGE
jgi:hypothetical protein